MDIMIHKVGDGHAVLRGIGGQNGVAVGEKQTDLHGGLLGKKIIILIIQDFTRNVKGFCEYRM